MSRQSIADLKVEVFVPDDTLDEDEADELCSYAEATLEGGVLAAFDAIRERHPALTFTLTLDGREIKTS